MLTFRFKEPAIATAPAIRHDIMDTHAPVSNSQNSVTGARTTISDTLKSPEGRRGKDQMVSTNHIPLVTE